MGNLDIFLEALRRVEDLHSKFPDVQTIQSIIRQLEYLIGVKNGSNDRSRLGEIILGVQAAREIEPLDGELAELLYRISDEAKQM